MIQVPVELRFERLKSDLDSQSSQSCLPFFFCFFPYITSIFVLLSRVHCSVGNNDYIMCTKYTTQVIKAKKKWVKLRKIWTYFIFSSNVPFVSNTKPHTSSLKAMPLVVPPQAANNQSATLDGTLSHNTSWMKALLLNVWLPLPDDRLNASLNRCSSAGDTANWKCK